MGDFTPGPWYSTIQPEWESEPVTAHIQSASKNEDNYVCAVEILDNECEANARLIAAAPEMYNGILRIIDEHSHIKIADTPDWLDKIARIINKVDNWP